jgi:hypothetical protein
MPNLVIHIGQVLDCVRYLIAQKPPITLAQIVQLFFTTVSATPKRAPRSAYEMWESATRAASDRSGCPTNNMSLLSCLFGRLFGWLFADFFFDFTAPVA